MQVSLADARHRGARRERSPDSGTAHMACVSPANRIISHKCKGTQRDFAKYFYGPPCSGMIGTESMSRSANMWLLLHPHHGVRQKKYANLDSCRPLGLSGSYHISAGGHSVGVGVRRMPE